MEKKTKLEYLLERQNKQGYDVPHTLCTLAYCADTDNYSCRTKDCNKCKFHNNIKLIVKTLLKEHKEKIIVTEDEKAILRNVPKKYEYIARDKRGVLYLYIKQPRKNNNVWTNFGTGYAEFDAFSHLFKFIKWEDEEPRKISKLLKEQGGN